MKILDIGCGLNKQKVSNQKDVVIGLDAVKVSGIDVVWNLEKTPLPFKKNEFDVVYAKHVLEHVENVVPLIKDIHRIIKPGGKLVISVPHFTWSFAFWDLTHKHFFGVHSLDPFIEGQEFNWVKYEFSIDKPLFRLIKRRIETSKWWFPIGMFANKFPDIYEKTGLKFLFPASTIYFELGVLKW
jgi:SAM-dependent methyltransferase